MTTNAVVRPGPKALSDPTQDTAYTETAGKDHQKGESVPCFQQVRVDLECPSIVYPSPYFEEGILFQVEAFIAALRPFEVSEPSGG
jgi:hypothetical protein